MKFDSVIIHYAEIGLKGKNRSSFENLLIKNIKIKCGKLIKYCVRDSGHMTISFSDNDKVSIDKLQDILTKIPGIAYISFAKKCKLDLDAIKKCSIDMVKDLQYKTFKVDSRRHNKTFKHTSMKVNELVGEAVLEKYEKKVKMKNPDLMLKIEISNKNVFVSYEDIKGVGGLPTNPKQKIVTLISGGFDSAVAAYLMMKRGCEMILVHFHNKNQMSSSVKDKIVKLAEQLSKFQITTKLYIVPFENIQKEIIMKTHSKLRMLVYRKFMIKIASKVANLEGGKFLVVGDSLSQVASQTIENLEATYHGSDVHILSPLIGLDKRDIIDISKNIGTYDISKQPYGDCCSYFLPKHPMLRADIKMLDKLINEFDIPNLIEDAVKNSKIIDV
tara:strand:+ start:653 stop:1813 length:1161 start_codon:yes stop_codon:yes gene_type:complete